MIRHYIAVFILIGMVNLAASEIKKTGSHRGRRYLVFPTPGPPAPTKVQLITGLGLPMEVDVSMIVGYVMKFNYALPYNASYLTHPYNALRNVRSIDRDRSFDYREEKNDDDEESARVAGGENEGVSPTRWEIYRVIESALERLEVSGKVCLLRTVCEAAEVPFENIRSGLFAELIHVLLTPSTTRDSYESPDDQQYHSAEFAGRNNPGKCEIIFPECDRNILEYFTEINVINEAMGRRDFSR